MRRFGKVVKDLNRVKLLTVHGAKGAEADNVFFFDNISGRIRDS